MNFEIDDLRIWYEIRGEGTPILFLHGWTMDHRDEALEYEPIFAERDGWSRLYLDLPGMGQSPSHTSIDSQDRYLALLLRFIDGIVGERRFVLAGTSAGAYLARGILHRRASQIDGLLLKVPVIIPDAARRDVPHFRPLIANADAMAALAPSERQELGEALIQSPAYLKALKQKLRTRVEPAQQAADMPRLDAIRDDPHRYAFSFDPESLAAPFNAPTLIVCGRQDTVVGYRDAWRILEDFPRATFAVLDRADHGLLVDQPKLFLALVHDWLDRIEELRPQA
jgi:pimeloyl-ACP methyl ester carboxylesterase